jgi:caffeoyl-CoA O-methyltransferase
MSNKTIGLPDRIYDYMLSVSLREPPILVRLRAETAKLPMSMMQIAPEQGQLLWLLVQALNPKRCLEVGVFTGYSGPRSRGAIGRRLGSSKRSTCIWPPRCRRWIA